MSLVTTAANRLLDVEDGDKDNNDTISPYDGKQANTAQIRKCTYARSFTEFRKTADARSQSTRSRA
jgi:hypothetical protein